MKIPFNIIVACDRNRGIGKDNALPWRLPSDLRYFNQVTTKVAAGSADSTRRNIVIMGRKTWESLPERSRPLPNRINIVISRDKGYPVPANVLLANSFPAALELAVFQKKHGEIFNIGGGQIFAEGLSHPDLQKVYLTEIDADFACDAYLEKLPAHFKKISTEPHEENGIKFEFAVYEG